MSSQSWSASSQVLAAVPGDVLAPGVQRIVRGGVGQVQKERLAVPGVPFDRPDGVVGKRVGRVVVLGELGDALIVVAEGANASSLEFRVGLRRVEEVAASVHEAIVLVEAPVTGTVRGLRAQVPLADQRGLVPRFAKYLAERDHVLVEQLLAATAFPRVEAGHQRRARRGALGVVVELAEAQPLGGQPVEVGRAHLAPVAADVRPAHVVSHDQDDVRSGPVGGVPDRRDGKNRKAHHTQSDTWTSHVFVSGILMKSVVDENCRDSGYRRVFYFRN